MPKLSNEDLTLLRDESVLIDDACAQIAQRIQRERAENMAAGFAKKVFLARSGERDAGAKVGEAICEAMRTTPKRITMQEFLDCIHLESSTPYSDSREAFERWA